MGAAYQIGYMKLETCLIMFLQGLKSPTLLAIFPHLSLHILLG